MYYGLSDGGSIVGLPEHRIDAIQVFVESGLVLIDYRSLLDDKERQLESHVEMYNRPASEWKGEWLNRIETSLAEHRKTGD